MPYGNTNLVDPLAGEDPGSIQKAFWHGAELDWDASKFVKQLRFPVLRSLIDTELGTKLAQAFPKVEDQLHQCEKSLVKLYLKLFIEEDAPRKPHWILTAPVDVATPQGCTVMSQHGFPIPTWLEEANAWESSTPLRFNMELMTAYFLSKTWELDKKEQAKRSWAKDELERVGNIVHFPEMTNCCRRFRTYDRIKHWSHQGDTVEKSSVWSAEALPAPDKLFYRLTQDEAGVNRGNYKNILGDGLPAAIDKHGIKKVAVAMAVKEFVSTKGFSSYLFSFDQRASGPAYQAIFEKNLKCMEVGNLLSRSEKGHDAYREVTDWLRTMDPHLRSFSVEDLRTTSKSLARGGIYEAGAEIAAFYILGMDPDKEDKLISEDLRFLKAHVELPTHFRNHPTFLDLMEGDEFASGTSWKMIYAAAKQWCTDIGMEALHNGIPTIRPFAKRLRDANAASIKNTGEMLSWDIPIGGTVYKVPFKTDMTSTHRVSASFNGWKGKATVTNVKYTQTQNCSADFVHTWDAVVRGLVVLSCKNHKESIRVLTNHDSFRLHACHAGKINRIWRNSLIHGLTDISFEKMGVKLPKGKDHNDLLDMIPENIVALFA